ncbi:MAG: hypothetical protein RJB61_2391 [Actinomycetota bacterium]|jgi:amidohydrolase
MSSAVAIPTSDELAPVVALRRHLHAHPELSGHEHQTAARVLEFLAPLQPDRIISGLGGTGIVATFDSGVPGPALLFRSELDALPIVEIGVSEHGSTCDGVSHKCGHDGHMAILCGLAQRLAARRPASGMVHLLFQPAEEDGTGAAAILADPAFAEIQPDRGFAIHNMPGFPMHSFVIKPGSITAAVRSIVIRFTGRTAHASEPEKGENPSLAIADLLRGCDEINVTDVSRPDFCLITPVHVSIGSPAYGVSAGEGEVHLTIRTFANSGLASLQQRIESLAASFADRDRLRLSVDTVEDFFANMNDEGTTDVAHRAASACGFDIISPDLGLRGGEDFGLFSERFPCCMVLLGSGEDYHPIHNPHYDFRDELIATGVRFFDTIVRDQLG